MKTANLLASFYYAFSGLFHFIRNDRNGKIHLCISLLVIIAGWYYCISATEWIAILLCIALVLSLEMCNHALEMLCDVAQPEIDPRIKTIKDVAAAAVLMAVLISVSIGAIIFWQRIF